MKLHPGEPNLGSQKHGSVLILNPFKYSRCRKIIKKYILMLKVSSKIGKKNT
jgi:hypothetical protein